MVTVLTDENGVLREYREVKRKANVGERIKIVSAACAGELYQNNDVLTVTKVYDSGHVYANTSDGRNAGVFYREYTALEPTDIVIIDGVRYREERRKARVGERILYVWEGEQSQVYTAICVEENGDVRVVDEYDDGTFMIHYGAYRVLTPIDEPKAEPSTTPAVYNVTINVTVNGTVDDVVQAVADAVKRELTKSQRLSSADLFVKAAESLAKEPAPKPKSPQQLRDEIVERAKRDIEELKTTHYPTLAQYYIARNITWNPECDAEFIVNREKRTIVCLLRAQRYDGKGKVVSRGIAKCAPDDCFNVHIGKVIALRRALGLPVPVKYLNAPQPTEVRVGDVVEITGNRQNGHFYHYYSIGDTGRVDKVGRYEGEIVVTPVKTRERKWPGYYQNVSLLDVKIIDDSREETEVSV
jgi:hypothetical protein